MVKLDFSVEDASQNKSFRVRFDFVSKLLYELNGFPFVGKLGHNGHAYLNQTQRVDPERINK